MTIQVDPAGPQFLMLLIVLATILLGAWAGVSAAGRRPVTRPIALLAGLILVYAATLVGVSAASGTTTLKTGDTKCFDEWCARMLGAGEGASFGALSVEVRLENHGRSAQRSLLARAFVDAGGRRYWPYNPDDLHVVVPGQGSVDVRFLFTVPSSLSTGRFVVTEAASGELTPGVIVIGDESSPFHPIAGWSLY